MSDQGRVACRYSTPLDGCSHTGDPCDGCPRRPQEAPPAAPASSLARDSAEWRVGEEPATSRNGGPVPAIEGVVSPLTNSDDAGARFERLQRQKGVLLAKMKERGREAVHDLAPLHEAAAKLREIGDARQALEEELFPLAAARRMPSTVLVSPTPLPAPHYDPDPPRKAPAMDGYRWCDGCEQAVSAVGHECWPTVSPEDGKFGEAIVVAVQRARAAEARAEFAESVLCAMAFAHGQRLALFGEFLLASCYATAIGDPCVFCSAAREGGR